MENHRIGRAASPGSVAIYDPALEADRKYRLKPRTRSVRRAIRDQWDRVDETVAALNALPDDADRDQVDDAEKAITGAFCDLLTVACEPPGNEDAPDPGALLFDGWLADELTDDEIAALVRKVVPTPGASATEDRPPT